MFQCWVIMWKYELWASVFSAIVAQPESEDAGGIRSGVGLHQNVACAAEQRTVTVTSVTPGRKGLSTGRQGCMGCVTQTGGWLELKGEVLSSEEHWLRAIAPSSLFPPPKLPPLPPQPSSPPSRYS